MIIITPQILKAIAPANRKPKLLAEIAKWMNHWASDYGVDTAQEWRHFIAQTAHESGSFNTLKEAGSIKYLSKYEGRKDLGNTQPGDGVKFAGAGLIMTTGRANYYALGVKRHNPQKFIKNPELLQQPEWGVWAAFEFWGSRKLNDIANMPDTAVLPVKRVEKGVLREYRFSPIEYITYRVNGWQNGIADRKAFYARACKYIQ